MTRPGGLSDTGTAAPCRCFVGGFGRPGMRDLDFGRQLIDCLQQLDWPEGVVIEDLPCAVPLVLHRLQELRPAKVVLLGAVPRGLDAPATLRRYRPDLTPSAPGEVHRSLEEPVTGLVDLDHTLVVARHWGGLPADTVVIEVEPAEASFGLGFSEELAGCIDPIMEMVREELGDAGEGMGVHPDFAGDLLSAEAEGLEAPTSDRPAAEPSEALTELVDYARHHAEARLQSHRAPSLIQELPSGIPRVAIAGRVRPWGVFLESGGDWFDAVPLDDGSVAIVVGSVIGRGAEVAATMSDLRAAVRAYLVLDGRSPARLMGNIDRLADRTGLGRGARLVCLTIDPADGQVRFTNAGNSPPLVVGKEIPDGRFLYAARAAPVGEPAGAERGEATLRLASGSTLLVFTDGLVESRTVCRDAGLEQLRRAVTDGPAPLDDLCDHVLDACTRSLRRDDDMCLLGVRRLAS